MTPKRTLPPLSQLDGELDLLQRQNPGWLIWYVPNATDGHVTWCAQRLPLLNCTSPRDLSEQIASAVEAPG